MYFSSFLMRLMLLEGASPTGAPKAFSTSQSTLQELLKLIGLIVVFVLIIVACYWVTRFVGNKQLGKSGKSNFKVLDVHKLGMNQSLAIVKIGTRYFCLGFSKDHIDTICELSESDFDNGKSDSGSTKSFGDVFSGILKKKSENVPPEEESSENN